MGVWQLWQGMGEMVGGGRSAEWEVGGLLAVLREASPKRGLTFYDGGGGPAVATILPSYIHTSGTHKKIFRPVVF